MTQTILNLIFRVLLIQF